MADDIVMQILQAIQANLAALDEKVSALDRKVSGQGRTLDVVRQDVRMIRATIRDMGETRVRSRSCTRMSIACSKALPI
jgi:septal ring factor EnvC (AmiA/AmiB activator)